MNARSGLVLSARYRRQPNGAEESVDGSSLDSSWWCAESTVVWYGVGMVFHASMLNCLRMSAVNEG